MKNIYQISTWGVRKGQLLYVVYGIVETYLDMAILFSLIRLDEVEYDLATDFKLLNIRNS